MPAYRTHSRNTPLEVTTDAPPPPTLAIISPTPRTFTFPGHASPFASPSVSPFEHQKKPLRIITPTHPHPLRCLTPDSAISDSSPTFSSPSSSIYLHSPARSRSPCAPAYKRRKSTGNVHELEVHRPKKGDDDYVKRPENAFILFRRKCVEDRLAAQDAAIKAAAADDADAVAKPKKHRQADLSKMISQQWRGLSAEEKSYWEGMAKEKKKEHEQLYPNYVYRPQRTKGKGKAAAGLLLTAAPAPSTSASRKGKGKLESEHDADDSVSFVLPLPPSPTTRHGRSNSAPSSQTIRLPVVNMPSCPTTPLLLPTLPISRRLSYDTIGARSAHRSTESSYDCMQSEPAPAPFPNQAEFEANFSTPEFYQGMWSSATSSSYSVDKNASLGIAPLAMPPMFAHGSFSPADSTSPTSPFNDPYTPTAAMPQMPPHFSSRPGFDSELDSNCMTTSSTCIPEYTDPMLPELLTVPWTFEFDGELCPGGADFLVDGDFDLGAIPPIQLDMPKYAGDFQDAAAGADSNLLTARPERDSAAGDDHGHHRAEQDPFAGYFFDEMMSAGRY